MMMDGDDDDDDDDDNNNDDDDHDDDDDDDDRIERRNSRFFTISSLRRELSPTHMCKWPGRNRVEMCNTSSVYRVQHAVCHLV